MRAVSFTMLVGAVVLMAVEVLLLKGGGFWWWKPPVRLLQFWTLLIAGVVLPLSYWACHGKRWALNGLALVGGGWCAATCWAAFRFKNPALGFYLVFLALGWILVWLWMRSEMDRSYFDPKLSWYQQAPKPISGLSCKLWVGNEKQEYRVARIDEDGLYLINSKGYTWKSRPYSDPIGLELDFRGDQVKGRGVPVSAVKRQDVGWVAMGVRFQGLTGDSKKELGDFVERLRGEGYVE